MGVLCARLINRSIGFAFEFLAGLDDLLHRFLDLVQIFRREWLGNVEVVVEAILDSRTDAQLGQETLSALLGQARVLPSAE